MLHGHTHIQYFSTVYVIRMNYETGKVCLPVLDFLIVEEDQEFPVSE